MRKSPIRDRVGCTNVAGRFLSRKKCPTHAQPYPALRGTAARASDPRSRHCRPKKTARRTANSGRPDRWLYKG